MIAVGASTACMYPQDTAESLEMLCQHGIHSFELFLNTFSEFQPNYLDKLKRIAREYDAQILSVHPFTSEMESMFFFSDYPARLADGLALYERLFSRARELGARFFIFHGGKEHFVKSEEEYFERYQMLLEAAKRQDLLLLHENVVRTKSHDLDFLLQLSKALPDARFVLDIKQAVRSGVSPFDFLEHLGNKVEHIHFSDHNAQKDCLPAGQGTLDLNRFFHQMLLETTCRSVVMELYRSSFGSVENIVESCHLISKILDDNLHNLDDIR